MNKFDLGNCAFEAIGAISAWFNVKKIRIDKRVVGVYWPLTAFWSLWGYWNLFYYGALNQPLSKAAGAVLAIANMIWVVHAIYYSRKTTAKPAPASQQMLLWCPECKARHIDAGIFATKLHHTHACQECGHCWRPAIEPTTGVQFLPGFKN